MIQTFWGKKSYEIVGVVRDAVNRGIADEVQPGMFVPVFQQTPNRLVFAIKTTVPPRSVIKAVRWTISNVDTAVPIFDIQTMDERIADSLFPQRFSFFMFGGFSLIALILAGLGVFGVMAFTVSTREYEIGVRMALGAQKSDILCLILKKGLWLTGIGAAIGMLGALSTAHILSFVLYQVKPTDPITLTTVTLVLAAVAMLACYLPARRATKVDPMVALRYE